MKKLIYFIIALFALSVVACGSDDDEEDITYLDNSIVEGRWYWIQHVDSHVIEFKNDVSTEYRYDKYINSLEQTIYNGKYKISEDRLYYSDSKDGILYKVDKDSLFLKYANYSDYVKYTKIKEGN